MTRLLVSVRSAAEAEAALAGGADIIDVKEPSRGSLGRADESVWREVVEAVAGRAPVSVALGELAEREVESGEWGVEGIAFAKIGLARCASRRDWREQLRNLWENLPSGTKPVAVIYADWQSARAPEPLDILAWAAESNVRYVLVDTCDKSLGGLLDHFSLAKLRLFAEQVANRDLRLVLAGSLNIGAMGDVLPLAPFAIAVRGAVCRAGRTGVVDSDLVARCKAAVVSRATV